MSIGNGFLEVESITYRENVLWGGVGCFASQLPQCTDTVLRLAGSLDTNLTSVTNLSSHGRLIVGGDRSSGF